MYKCYVYILCKVRQYILTVGTKKDNVIPEDYNHANVSQQLQGIDPAQICLVKQNNSTTAL